MSNGSQRNQETDKNSGTLTTETLSSYSNSEDGSIIFSKPEAQVVLLMDSNGKYLDTKRLFPGLITRAKRCRNTGQAMELLRQDTLGNPQYIVVHTGTNDLHTLHRETAEAMTKMAKRASREFPNSRIELQTSQIPTRKAEEHCLPPSCSTTPPCSAPPPTYTLHSCPTQPEKTPPPSPTDDLRLCDEQSHPSPTHYTNI
ncbi:hypothetical protein AAFF_G00344950 [Aldrovandia affinis]|uniref:Uncharacterized protein n=1 Tax=Aldrovandia affinis TaxID=143900 RepID=A0AAD7R5Q5_9TELE|nr:hypothetical protein AAFF_G00344950 [Aldrovandia affinis]